MLQICTLDIFRLAITAVRQGNFGSFGVIQGCLDMGDQERTRAKALLEELGVSDEELIRLTQGYWEYQATRRSTTSTIVPEQPRGVP